MVKGSFSWIIFRSFAAVSTFLIHYQLFQPWSSTIGFRVCARDSLFSIFRRSKIASLHQQKQQENGEDHISQELTSNDMSHVRVLPKLFQPHSSYGDLSSVIPEDATSSSSSSSSSNLFSSLFRHSAPYIAMHRGSTIVLHIAGHVFKKSSRSTFEAIMDDIAILHLLGVKCVLVIGVREQLDERIFQSGETPLYHHGMRVTNEKMLQYLKEESGRARFEVESCLARGFRGTTENSGISVISGNLFYSAKPLGVRQGIDFQYTGEVRKVEIDALKVRLAAGDIVMLTSLGYSTNGAVYNVPSESLAAETAARLKASKIIYFTEGEGLVDMRSFRSDDHGINNNNHNNNNPDNDVKKKKKTIVKKIQSLRLSQASSLLQRCGINKQLYNYVEEEHEAVRYNNNNREKVAGEKAGASASTAATAAISVEGIKPAAEGGYLNISYHGVSGWEPTTVPTPTPSSTAVSASSTAAADASKALLPFTSGNSVLLGDIGLGHPSNGGNADGGSESSGHPNGVPLSAAENSSIAAFIRLIGRCVYALTGGVKRAHLITAYGGSLLKELYTRDGAGMLISRDMYEGIRPVQEIDLLAIQEIIQPLEREGILIPRSYDDLLYDLPHMFVMSREGSILAFAMLKAYNGSHGEIACLAVHPSFRKEGRGELMLAYLERRAVLMGLSHIFVLSTRTMQWFEERGFIASDPRELPTNKAYNKERNSKVYLKLLGSTRDVDAEELLWNIS